VSGTIANPEGITNPPIDELLEKTSSKYALVIFAAETGLRTNEWVALERRDLDRQGRAVTVHRRYAGGVMTPYPKTQRSRRRVLLSALAAAEALPLGWIRRSSSQPPEAATSASTRGGRGSGTRRFRRPGLPGAARTRSAIRSLPRPSPQASPPSSWPGS